MLLSFQLASCSYILKLCTHVEPKRSMEKIARFQHKQSQNTNSALWSWAGGLLVTLGSGSFNYKSSHVWQTVVLLRKPKLQSLSRFKFASPVPYKPSFPISKLHSFHCSNSFEAKKKRCFPTKELTNICSRLKVSECASWALMGTAWPTSLTLVITLCIFPNLFSHLKEVFRKPGNVWVVQHRGVLHEVPPLCPPLPLTLFHVANDKACL